MSEHRTVTATTAKQAIKVCFDMKRPMFLWGGPGIGKSEVVAAIGEEAGGLVIDLRLSQMDQTDLRGIPYFNKDIGKMDWAAPVDLPDEETAAQYPIVILFLDEMNSAAPSVQAVAYQLILNRKVGKYSLPDNVVVIAAGNRDSDKGVTYRMPTPLANRFVHLEMRADFDAWLDWAIGAQISPEIIGYLSNNKQDLYDFDPKSSSRSFASPRTWKFVDDILRYKNIDDSTAVDLISGAIGEGLAIKYMTHRKFVGNLPKVEDVLTGKETKLATKEVSAMYSLITALCYQMKQDQDNGMSKDKMNERANNFLGYCMDNFEIEISVMGGRLFFKNYQIEIDSSECPNFTRFTKEYFKYKV